MKHNKTILISDCVCEQCLKPLKEYSDENDFICEEHGFTNALHPPSGALIAGDGFAGPFRYIRAPKAE